ncbi:MAG TPA: hypothetical protein GX694_07575 [Actinomycetales bacterium]|nr:hypothetical protein [Actinomycetales bacterium]
MYPGQDDQTRRMGRPGQDYGYDDRQYQGGGYADGGYADGGAAVDGPGRGGPKLDMTRFVGSVVATAVVAALAGGLGAWIVDALFARFGHTWANGGNTPTMYAIYGAVAALVAGLLWFLLHVGTPNPSGFFGWIIGLTIVAAVALPLLITPSLLDGLAAAVVNLFIGLPIYALTGTFARTWRT